MFRPTYHILYVTDTKASEHFYTAIFGQEPCENSSTFVGYVYEDGIKLGLWQKEDVLPVPERDHGSCEMAVAVASPMDINRIYESWVEQNLDIIQEPTQMDFGYTCAVSDPDGYCVRFFSPEESEAM